MKTPSDTGEPVTNVTAEGEVFASAPRRIEYPPFAIPEPGDYTQVAPGIVWVRIPMPMELNHINLWLLEDGEGWTLIDSGFNSDMGRETWLKLEAKLFADRPLRRIFITHLHPDHLGMARWLQERHGATVWMSSRGVELARAYIREPTPDEAAAAQSFIRSHGFADQDIVNRFFSGRLYRSAVSGIPDIERHPIDGDRIAIGAAEWRTFETDGHAEGHQCLFDAERRVLISGDQVLPTISSNVSFGPRGEDRNPLRSYLESLERLSALDATTLVLPSHGRPFFGLRARAADLQQHHQKHLAALKHACAAPKTAFEALPVLFQRRLVGAGWMFAMGEAIAHLEYLALDGALRRETDAAGVVRYAMIER